MEIEIVEIIKQKKKIEVEFPIYRAHHLDNSSIYTRVDEDLTYMEVQKTSHNRNIEEYNIMVGKNYQFDASSPDYHLGRGIYASSSRNSTKR